MQQQRQQHFGTTSDYWSTATSTSRSDPSIYLQPQHIGDYLLDQQRIRQQQQQQRRGLSQEPSANSFVGGVPTPTSMLTQANDDYYVDVATAAAQSYFQDQQQQQNFDMRYRQQLQLPTSMPINQQQQFVGGPIHQSNNIDSLIDDHEYLRSISGQFGFSSPQSGYHNASDMQQQQQNLSFGVHPSGHRQHLINLYNQNQLSSLMLSNEDYDDYAIPSDEHCCRLDRSQVELVQLIGEGQKGYVFLGKLQSKDGQRIIDVAIKTLKYETNQLIDRLMSEAAMMRQLEHPHIIKFIGVCPETPALIAMELALFGELKQYLKSYRHLIRISQLILFTFQISTALSYLESKHYVHRDVAARNVLVCSHNCVKLADFDLTRNLQQLQPVARQLDCPKESHPNRIQASEAIEEETEDYNDREYISAPRVKLPVRWLAPESLIFRRFTSASDVWMFAVCSWELFQFVQMKPWPHLRNNQVLFAIESGQRLPRPANCPLRLYQLLLSCWNFVPNKRPKFREIKQSIWSIYLSERTREQMEFERLVRKERQKLTSAHSFEIGQLVSASAAAAAAMDSGIQSQLVSVNHEGSRLMLVSPDDSNATTMTTPTDLIDPNGYYDEEQQQQRQEQAYSSANSLIGSLRRTKSKGKIKQQLQNQAIGEQMNRFERCLPANARRHKLQKQRSQGTITQLDERQPVGEDRQLGGRHFSPVAVGRKNNFNDDGALLDPKAANKFNYNQWYAQRFRLADNESPADGDLKCDLGGPSRFSAGQLDRTKAGPAHEGPNKLGQQSSFAADLRRDTCAQIVGQKSKNNKSNKKHNNFNVVSIENNSRNFSTNRPVSWQLHIQPPKATANKTTSQLIEDQIHRCRATNQRQSAEASRQQYRFSNNPPNLKHQEHDQLGQVLQTLHLTPTKSKSKSPPAQRVRVFSRDTSGPHQPADGSNLASEPSRTSNKLGPQSQFVQETTAPTSQLQLHQRLLGRIKLATSMGSGITRAKQQQQRDESPRPTGSPTSNRANQASNLVAAATKAETVDQSLQILQSLISNQDLNVKRNSQSRNFFR